ncbi:hypothetical protein PSPTOT1_3718 [Pseudomonas syringae pv. tomato T1]|nr:hypothetical protein PSPTOT1_3718 [Pseudomonas syringae pv. tomato T1]
MIDAIKVALSVPHFLDEVLKLSGQRADTNRPHIPRQSAILYPINVGLESLISGCDRRRLLVYPLQALYTLLSAVESVVLLDDLVD